MEQGKKGDEAMCCMQLGMVTWLLALLAIELALTHHAVWKVSPLHLPHLSIMEHPRSSHIKSWPHCHKPSSRRHQCPQICLCCNLQGWLSRLWQIGVIVAGAAVVALAIVTPHREGAYSAPDFEMVMEGRSKNTPETRHAAV